MDVSPTYGGVVEVNQTIPTSYPAGFNIASGESVRLKAVPNTDYVFASWNGSLSDTANPIAIVMNCNKRITANFNRLFTPITEPDSNDSTGTLSDNYTFSEEDEVTMTADPDSGWPSDSWTDDVTEPESSDTTSTVDSNKNVITNFEQIKLNWGLVYGIIAGVVIIAVATLLVFRYRTVSNK